MAREISKWHRSILIVGLFFLVWGGKLTVIDRFGSDLPWWDDWGAIGEGLLVPYQQGNLDWRQLWAPHNEHRIAGTRLLDLALFAANGQWDARLECAVNAALHALIVIAAFLVGSRLLPRGGQLVWFGILAVLTAPPVVWENIIRGFDSQHYLLIGFSLAAIVLLLTAAPGTRRWWSGLACAVAALFTMGSGLVASGVVVVVVLATTPPSDWWRGQRWTLVAGVAVALVGWALHHKVPGHAPYRVQHAGEFFIAFWHHLQWPLVRHPLFGAVSWLPWAWLAWRCVRRDSSMGSGERVVVAVGLWALVHFAAMAWFRGGLQPWPPTRGLENVVVGVAVNALALVIAMSRVQLTGWRRVLRGAAVAGGVATAAFGLQAIIRENLTIVLPALTSHARRVEANVREFVRTGDLARLNLQELPYPFADSFVIIVSRPEMQAILPASVRQPVTLVGRATPDGSFRLDGVPPEMAHPAGASVWGSFTDGTAVGMGEWRSEPMATRRFPYWQLDVFRSQSSAGVALDLATNDGAIVANLSPPGVGVRRWTPVIAAVPDEPFAIVARDQSETAWLAFTEPVAIGGLSRWAYWLAAHGGWMAALGGALAAWGWMAAFRARQR